MRRRTRPSDEQCYGIPWGCLVLVGFENLLVAVHNFYAEHAAQASVLLAGPAWPWGKRREQAPCTASGKAEVTHAAFDNEKRDITYCQLGYFWPPDLAISYLL